MRIYFLVGLLSMVVSIVGFSQNPTDLMQGKVIDSKSRQPVPFASVKIWVSNRLFGVITNGEGDFQIPSSYKNQIDSVVVSCIGYAKRLIKPDQLVIGAENSIALTPSALQLTEVEIKTKSKLSAAQMVSNAITFIPKNYSRQSYSYVGYYRDYQLKENKYYNLNEALVGVFDKGFDSSDYRTTGIKLYRYVENNDFPKDPSISVPYGSDEETKFVPSAKLASSFGGNELSFLRIHDAIRNNKDTSYSFVGVMSKDFVKNHNFTSEGTVFLDNAPLYHVTFHTKSTASGPAYFAKGEIFIERGNFAIHKMTYSVYKKEFPKPLLLYDIQLEYTRRDALMYLNYVSVNNFFKVKSQSFKMIGIELDTSHYALDIKLNAKPDSATALNKDNYLIFLHDKRLEIKQIKLVKKKPQEIRVYLSKSEFNSSEKFSTIASQLVVNFENIVDTNGRKLNETLNQSAFQFRELFLQKINPANETADWRVFISKEKPLSKNTRKIKDFDATSYWMNTPLRKK